jgi:chemotaxis signal transduction protein
MTASKQVDEKLLALREAFDRSFAKADEVGRLAYLDFLSIRIAGDAYALRLSELASLHVDRKLVVAPSLLPELLGIAGFRTVLTPIYDLGALLGYATGRTTKWLVVAQSPTPIGFAFDAFDAHLRVPVEHVSAVEAGESGPARGAVRHGPALLPLLHLPSFVEGIAQRIKALGPSQER